MGTVSNFYTCETKLKIMNQKLEKKSKKAKKADDNSTDSDEVKSPENVDVLENVEPNHVETGKKVKKSKKKKNLINEIEAQKSEEMSLQPSENGKKSKKAKKIKTEITTESTPMNTQDPESSPKVKTELKTELKTEPTENVHKVNMGKKLKQSLIAENAYITSLMSIINFPKRDDSDDDDVTMNKGKKKLLNRKGGAQSVQELRQRLKAKLESLQGPKSDKPGKKKKLSKEEKKLKIKEENRLKSKLAKIAPASASSTKTITNGISKAKPVYNSDGKMVYSKFDLGTKSALNGTQNNKKKDPKSTLQSIQKQKDKLKRLEEKGETEIAKNMEESSAWTKALDKTEGVKVKDDVGLLKKSIKKMEQKKKSSSKKWVERKEGEKKKMDARQQKRTENIKKRKTDKKANKMKKLAKKGRSVPGFR